MTEDEMIGWHHWLDAHESEWTPGVGDGQGGLACCGSWSRRVRHYWVPELNWINLIPPQGCKELDTTEQLTHKEGTWLYLLSDSLNFKLSPGERSRRPALTNPYTEAPTHTRNSKWYSAGSLLWQDSHSPRESVLLFFCRKSWKKSHRRWEFSSPRVW